MNIESVVPVIRKASVWVIIWGIVTFVCGILAIILPLTFSFGIALIVGCLLLVAGIAPNSSDGVVPYWSSHLDGARSELIVPSKHPAQRNPRAIAEVARILKRYHE